jgi:hypothetical protein
MYVRESAYKVLSCKTLLLIRFHCDDDKIYSTWYGPSKLGTIHPRTIYTALVSTCHKLYQKSIWVSVKVKHVVLRSVTIYSVINCLIHLIFFHTRSILSFLVLLRSFQSSSSVPQHVPKVLTFAFSLILTYGKPADTSVVCSTHHIMLGQ